MSLMNAAKSLMKDLADFGCEPWISYFYPFLLQKANAMGGSSFSVVPSRPVWIVFYMCQACAVIFLLSLRCHCDSICRFLTRWNIKSLGYE